jgi:hypothetical protein
VGSQGREAAALELQRCQLWEMETGKGSDKVWPFSEGKRGTR